MYQIPKEIALRKNELENASEYKIVILPKGMNNPTQEFLEEIIEEYFI